MRASRPAVHPVEAPPAVAAQVQEQAQAQGHGEGEGVAHPRGVRIKDPPGAPGTPAGLGLRLAQAFFAAAALAVMASTNDFPSVSAFRSDASLFFWIPSPPLVRGKSELTSLVCLYGWIRNASNIARCLACEISEPSASAFSGVIVLVLIVAVY